MLYGIKYSTIGNSEKLNKNYCGKAKVFFNDRKECLRTVCRLSKMNRHLKYEIYKLSESECSKVKKSDIAKSYQEYVDLTCQKYGDSIEKASKLSNQITEIEM